MILEGRPFNGEEVQRVVSQRKPFLFNVANCLAALSPFVVNYPSVANVIVRYTCADVPFVRIAIRESLVPSTLTELSKVMKEPARCTAARTFLSFLCSRKMQTMFEEVSLALREVSRFLLRC